MYKKGNAPLALVACGLGICCALFPGWLHAQQSDPTEERIKKLEEQLEAVTQELKKVKEEAAANKQKATAPSQEAQALKKEVDQLKGEIADVKEQAAATDAKAEQTGVRAYLGPGLVFEDPRGRWRMQVSARAQLDYRAFKPGFTDADTFSIRRARIGVGATMLTDYYVYVEEEFANQATNPAPSNAPQLTYAYLDLNWWRPNVRFRLGQFKPYIGLDNSMLDLQTDFLERALTQSLFQNFVYDRGVMVFGEPIAGLVYSAALTNGTGQNVDELQGNAQQVQGDGKMTTLRLVNDFAQSFKISDTVIHFGGTYQWGSAANSPGVVGSTLITPYSAASVQTEARGLTFFIPQPFNPPTGPAVVSNIGRTIFDIEAALAVRNFKIQGDYVQVDYSGTIIAPGTKFDRTLKAYYATLGWVISGEYYSDWYREGTFVRPRPANNFGWGKGNGWGLWELNFRYSFFDGTDFNNNNPLFTGRPGTSASFPNITQGTNKAFAYSLGLKWQPNLYTRFMLNLIHTSFDTPVTVNGQNTTYENAVTLRAQADF
jgi:phosphate-selective porin OprO/OprP